MIERITTNCKIASLENWLDGGVLRRSFVTASQLLTWEGARILALDRPQ